MKRIAITFLLTMALAAGLALTSRTALSEQDRITSGINLGAPKIKLAVPDFPPKATDQQLVTLTQEFNQVLWNDLSNSGIFDMAGKSNFPLSIPLEPQEVNFKAWSHPPATAAMLVFGKTESHQFATRLLRAGSSIWETRRIPAWWPSAMWPHERGFRAPRPTALPMRSSRRWAVALRASTKPRSPTSAGARARWKSG